MKINSKMGTLIFVIIGALVTVASGIVGYSEKVTAAKKSAEKDSVIHDLTDTLNKVKAELKESTSQIISLSNKLLDTTESLSNSYKQNAELQKSVNDFLTGGNNMPIFQVLVYPTNDNKGQRIVFDCTNMGQTPIRSVTVLYWDHFDRNYSPGTVINLGDIPARFSPPIDYEFKLPSNVDTFDISATVVWNGGGYRCMAKGIRDKVGNITVENKYNTPEFREFKIEKNKDGAFRKFIDNSK